MNGTEESHRKPSTTLSVVSDQVMKSKTKQKFVRGRTPYFQTPEERYAASHEAKTVVVGTCVMAPFNDSYYASVVHTIDDTSVVVISFVLHWQTTCKIHEVFPIAKLKGVLSCQYILIGDDEGSKSKNIRAEVRAFFNKNGYTDMIVFKKGDQISIGWLGSLVISLKNGRKFLEPAPVEKVITLSLERICTRQAHREDKEQQQLPEKNKTAQQ